MIQAPIQHRSFSCASVVLCALSSLAVVHAEDRTDAVFIQQLLRRNLFDVADRFCETRRSRSLNLDEGSEWARRLADIEAQRAWLQDSSSRNELLNRQIDQLETVFNSGAPLKPEARIRTRFAQIQLSLTGLKIQLLLENAGHLCSRPESLPRAFREAREKKTTGFSATEETLELLDALLVEVDRDRKVLGHAAGELRDHGRLLKANLHFLRAAQAKEIPQVATVEIENAVTAANSVVRATREDATKQKAYELIAGCQLLSNSSEELESHVRRLDTLYPELADKRYQLLPVVARLRHQDADGALRFLAAYEPKTGLGLQTISWLQLEAALIKFETAAELQDEDLAGAASRAFRAAAVTMLRQTTGAYREAAERVIARFELSEAVGVEVADLVELVADYREQNEHETALGIIAAATQRLPTDGWRAKAALALTAGEILIAQSRFAEARMQLSLAVEGFGKSGDAARQAAADLLRIFSIGQSISDSPDAAGRRRYVEELRRHLAAYPRTVSANKARQWLIAAIRTEQPLECYQLLKDELSGTTGAPQRFQVLTQMALILPSDDAHPEVRRTHEEFCALLSASADELGEQDKFPDVLRFLQIEYDAGADEPVWPDIYAELKTMSDTLPAELQRLDPSGRLQCRYLVLLTVAIARATTDIDVRRQMQSKLTAFNEDAGVLANQLAKHIDEATMQSGDQWLASILDTLVRRIAREAKSVSQLIELLHQATRLRQISGRPDVQDELLNRLTSQQLNQDELNAIAKILTEARTQNNAGKMQHSFWSSVVENNQEGSELWLEATVQLAELAAVTGKKDAARRRLGVANILFPDWGKEDRRERALALLRKLRE